MAYRLFAVNVYLEGLLLQRLHCDLHGGKAVVTLPVPLCPGCSVGFRPLV